MSKNGAGRKGSVFLGCSALAISIDKNLSKWALIDLVYDLAVRQLGEDRASHEAVASLIDEWMATIAFHRGDKFKSVTAEMPRQQGFIDRNAAIAEQHRQREIDRRQNENE